MSSIELSVIIPAYNAGQTIGRCLDSVLQSVQQAPVEIVCVDDGSKDNTWEILQSYSKKYACLRIFRECKIVCVNRYCMNLLYAPYWGKQR